MVLTIVNNLIKDFLISFLVTCGELVMRYGFFEEWTVFNDTLLHPPAIRIIENREQLSHGGSQRVFPRFAKSDSSLVKEFDGRVMALALKLGAQVSYSVRFDLKFRNICS